MVPEAQAQLHIRILTVQSKLELRMRMTLDTARIFLPGYNDYIKRTSAFIPWMPAKEEK